LEESGRRRRIRHGEIADVEDVNVLPDTGWSRNIPPVECCKSWLCGEKKNHIQVVSSKSRSQLGNQRRNCATEEEEEEEEGT
jgi:hypothetical protein